jgi:hypothetical protein
MPPKVKTDEELHPENYFKSPVGHPRDRIIVHPSQKIPKEGLFLSLNGFAFLIKPGVEVNIPRPVRHMLDTRIETETIQGDDGKEYTRDIPRITYTLVRENVAEDGESLPSPEAIEAAKAQGEKEVSFP